MAAPTRFRFAPSPNGALHLGHAYSASLNQGFAQTTGGALLLRIEDIDTVRCTPELEAAICRDLAWLGLEWETPVRRQSEHFDAYRDALDTLIARELVYPAFMSRAEMRAHIIEQEATGQPWPRDPDGVPVYPALDRAMSKRQRETAMASGAPFAWRLDMEKAFAEVGALSWRETSGLLLDIVEEAEADPAAWGDVILARRDTPTSYHLSVVVDDALQGITHVVRGADLRAATSVHRVLQALLGLPAPAYHHHRLILGPDGHKLSKSRGDLALAALREAGQTPDDIRRLVGLD